jgi:asparagine synthetase B (glutamine-hydrolysing)
MGGILAVASAIPVEERKRRLEEMARLSPYRGALRAWHFSRISIGCQSRTTDATWHETDTMLIVAHGRPYAIDCEDPSPPGAQGAALAGRLFAESGIVGLARLDGEYALLIHDKISGANYACVCLMMARQLYHGRGAVRGEPLLVLASEVRQVAAGAGIGLRLDPEQVVQSLCLNGPVLDRRRTEYHGIDRLVGPDCYRLDHTLAGPSRLSPGWTPPEPQQLGSAEREMLPHRIVSTLQAALRASPVASALTLSGGYDSGTLWAVAYADRARRAMPRAMSLSLPGLAGDETETVRAMLRLTGQSGMLIRATTEPGRETAGVDGEAVLTDRIPLTMGYDVAVRFPRAMREAGLSCHILGIGAEAGLTGYPYYLADDLRCGRLLRMAGDWLRLESYYEPRGGWRARLRLLWWHGLVPRGSRLRPAWNHRPLVPLSRTWMPVFVDALREFWAERRRHGFARGVQLEQLRHYTLITGIEAHEQLNERHGIELHMPFLHRRTMEQGLRLPLRELACAVHDKELLRRAATAALGVDPPWPRRKVLPGLVGAEARPALLGLGPPAAWRLVQQGILDGRGAKALVTAATAGQAWHGSCARIVAFETFLRGFDA